MAISLNTKYLEKFISQHEMDAAAPKAELTAKILDEKMK